MPRIEAPRGLRVARRRGAARRIGAAAAHVGWPRRRPRRSRAPEPGGRRPQERRLPHAATPTTDAKTHAHGRRPCASAAPTATAATRAVQGGGQRGLARATRTPSARPTCCPKQPRASGRRSANPERSYTALLEEDLDFVRFVNPGDLRAAPDRLRAVPQRERGRAHVSKSMMTHGGMLYGAALYNNGVLPVKDADRRRELRPRRHSRAMLQDDPAADRRGDARRRACCRSCVPFPRWELGQPGNPFRVFERGGRRRLEVGPARSVRGARASPTRGSRRAAPARSTAPTRSSSARRRRASLDPMLSLLGTNDHPGDYRSSGCTACHVVYANDRSPVHSGPYAAVGNRGTSQQRRPDDPEGRAGPPAQARLHARRSRRASA